MNLLLLKAADLTSPGPLDAVPPDPVPPDGTAPLLATATVDGDRLLHLRKVLKVEVGQEVRVGLLNGSIGSATVTAIDRSVAKLDVVLDQAPPPALEVELLLALPRPKFLGRILQHATTIGVKEITLFHSARVEKSYWSSALMQGTALNRHLELGLEQGRDTALPKITLQRSFADLLESLEDSAAVSRHLLVADGDAPTNFPRQSVGPASLLIGPEGGLIDRELELLVQIGAQCGSLGQRPLRVETAVAACLSRLLLDRH